MTLPANIAKGTRFFYAAEDGTHIQEWKFCRWVGDQMWYAMATTGHQPRNDRCFLDRKDAVKYCVNKLKALIRELEKEPL